jgi:thiol-disulfide isomerase/thioredoxin
LHAQAHHSSKQLQNKIYSHPSKKFLLYFTGEVGDGTNAQNYIDNLLRPLGVRNRGKIHVLAVTHDDAAKHAKGGLAFLKTNKKWPFAAIVEQRKGFFLISRYTVDVDKYMYPPHTQDGLQKYIDLFLADKLEYYIKSEDTHEHDPSKAVQTVVGSEFEEKVAQGKNNIVVFFHRDGCRHCQATAPVVEEVATALAGKVEFVEFETFKNDLLNQGIGKLKNVPAIYMFPADSKGKPIEYTGGNTDKGKMEAWALEHATGI